MKRVTVDLTGPTITGTLPFDTPFLLEGEVPANVVAVSVARYQYPRSGGVPEDKDIPWTDTVRWSVLPGAAGEDGPIFIVRMSPLEPEEYYKFHFLLERQINDSELAQLHARAQSIIDRHFRNHGVAATTVAVAEELRTALITDLRRIADAQTGRIIAPGTIFDPARDYADVHDEFNRIIASVGSTQDNRQFRLEDYEAAAIEAEARLNRVLALQGLRNLVEHIDFAASRNPTFNKYLESTRASLNLVKRSDSGIRRLAWGMDADAVNPPRLEDLWTKEEIEPFVRRYTEAARQLEQLESTLQGLVDPRRPGFAYVREMLDAKRHSPPLAAADLVDVQRLVADTAFASAQGALSRALTHTNELRDVAQERSTALSAAADQFKLVWSLARVGEATTTPKHDTGRDWYVSADLGFAYLTGINTAVPYSGVNIYFRPVNRDVPLSQKGSFGHRFSATVGVTLNGIKDEAGTRDDLFGSNSLLFGFGYRVSQIIRVGVGGVLFRREDPGGTRSDMELAVNPYGNISLDIDVKKIPGLGSLFD